MVDYTLINNGVRVPKETFGRVEKLTKNIHECGETRRPRRGHIRVPRMTKFIP
jgi:hypothetical protein